MVDGPLTHAHGLLNPPSIASSARRQKGAPDDRPHLAWGWTRPEDTEGYSEYRKDTGIAEYETTPGNRGGYLVSQTRTR